MAEYFLYDQNKSVGLFLHTIFIFRVAFLITFQISTFFFLPTQLRVVWKYCQFDRIFFFFFKITSHFSKQS